MTETDHVAAIRARWAKATPGPWTSHDIDDETDWCGHWVVDLPHGHGYMDRLDFGDMEVNDGQDLRNADAVAAAPEDVAYLLDRNETLERQLAEARCQRDQHRFALERIEAFLLMGAYDDAVLGIAQEALARSAPSDDTRCNHPCQDFLDGFACRCGRPEVTP